MYVQNQPPLRISTTLITYLIISSFFCAAIYFNLPDRLQSSHPKIIESKVAARAVCKHHLSSMEYSHAYHSLYNNTLSKHLYSSYLSAKSQSLSIFLMNYLQPLIFGTGVMTTVNPWILLLFIAYAMKLAGLCSINSIFPLSLQSVTIPLIYSVCTSCTVIFAFFHFVIENQRCDSCLYISGHWYTFTLTTLIMAIIYVHLTINKGIVKSIGFGVYWFVYSFITLNILKTTQIFFHDSEEAIAGIYYALLISPIVMLVFMATEYFSREISKTKKVKQKI